VVVGTVLLVKPNGQKLEPEIEAGITISRLVAWGQAMGGRNPLVDTVPSLPPREVWLDPDT